MKTLKKYIAAALLLTSFTAHGEAPRKLVSKTPFCSNMNTKIDQAPTSSANLKPDRIVVSKSRKKMYLLSEGTVIGQYAVAFGFGAFDGPKSQIGDGRTPEGIYEIDFKKKNSSYTKALHISYPNDEDQAFADSQKLDAGGSIMIHGFPKAPIDGLDPAEVAMSHPLANWTQGCIAVNNEEIEEIFARVDTGVIVEICPLETPAPVMTPTQVNAEAAELNP